MVEDNFIVYFGFKSPYNTIIFRNYNSWQEHPILLYYSVVVAIGTGRQIDSSVINIISNNIDSIELDSEDVTGFLKYIIERNVVVDILKDLQSLGLLNKILPELSQLDHVQVKNGREHKNAFTHSLGVITNLLNANQSTPVVLRWAALFHDLGKLTTKQWNGKTWSYNNHAGQSYYLTRNILSRYPVVVDTEALELLSLVKLHMRPIVLVGEDITDSAVRRLITESSPYTNDLMELCMADVTTTNSDHKIEVYHNLISVKDRISAINEIDRYRRVQLPMATGVIMEHFGVSRCMEFTAVLNKVKHKIIDENYPNEYGPVMELLESLLKESKLI